MSRLKIIILDYSTDKSETALIKRWLPEQSEVVSYFIDTAESFPDISDIDTVTHVIHTGSFLSITKEAPFTKKAIRFIRLLSERSIPQMGICYGHQLLCLAIVGPHAVRRSPHGLEAGWCTISFTGHVPIPEVSKEERVWQSHFDEAIQLPPGALVLAKNEHSQIQAFMQKDLGLFGTQFHPEFDRESGNTFFQKDKKLLEKNQISLPDILQKGPSLTTGRIIFNFFLNFKKTFRNIEIKKSIGF